MKKKSKQTLVHLAEEALQKAVHEAIEDHARTGDSIVILKNGRVVEVPAKSIKPKKIRRK